MPLDTSIHGRQDMLEKTARSPCVLVVDDDSSMAEMIADGLSERGYDPIVRSSSRDASRLLQEDHIDALVTDLRMPGVDGLGLLAVSKKVAPERPVIVMTAYSAVDTAVESIREGAYHYLTKPFKVDELALFLARALDDSKLRRETAALRRALRDRYGIDNLIGTSAGMREVAELVNRVADTTVPVLVTGETGTGKGVVARAIHAQGRRANAPFVTINCAAIPENLLESELFGHVRGAFTGAAATRAGLFEEADGGTIFLDEIGEMTPSLQAKLLHVLENGTVRAVGSAKERPVDVRVVAATHRKLRERIHAGTFREDLLYRLDVISIHVPPLRHRIDDLPVLLEHFLAQARSRHPASTVARFAPEATKRLFEYSWPGNVRELEHLVERVVLLSQHAEVSLNDLPPALFARRDQPIAFDGDVIPLRELQKYYAQWAYERLGGKKLFTAEKLGVDSKTLAKMLETSLE